MLRFTKIRLAGFKSFVDPTSFVIEPGLTGVVGPNGCGKSNLVEALRWAMALTRVIRMVCFSRILGCVGSKVSRSN